MTLRSDLRERYWRSNLWARCTAACLAAMVLWMTLVIWLHLGLLGNLVSLLPDAAYATCFVKAGRTARRLSVAQEDARLKAREAAAVLRTPRAPDAGPDQCPVCGGYGLDALAADDAFMERGPDQAKVVAYGRRRAHWDCAEFVPHVPTAVERTRAEHERNHGYERGRVGRPSSCELCNRDIQDAARAAREFVSPRGGRSEGPLGGYWRCRFCYAYRWAPTMQAAQERLIAHAKECPKRPRPDVPLLADRSFRSRDGLVAQFIASESARLEGKLRASIDPSVLRMLGDGF